MTAIPFLRSSIAVLLFFCGNLCLAQTPAPSYKALKYPPLREVKIPDVAKFTLSNGIRLYLLEDHELPTVRGFALIRTGNLFDPKDKIGLATITGMVMRTGGTRAKTGDQIDEQLENIAASVESRIDEGFGEVQFSTLKNTTDEVLGVFHDVLTQPEFRQEKIDLVKTQFRSSISRRNDDAAQIAQREFTDIVYGKDSPYGWQIEYETVDRIKREDLQAFYGRYFFLRIRSLQCRETSRLTTCDRSSKSYSPTGTRSVILFRLSLRWKRKSIPESSSL